MFGVRAARCRFVQGAEPDAASGEGLVDGLNAQGYGTVGVAPCVDPFDAGDPFPQPGDRRGCCLLGSPRQGRGVSLSRL